MEVLRKLLVDSNPSVVMFALKVFVHHSLQDPSLPTIMTKCIKEIPPKEAQFKLVLVSHLSSRRCSKQDVVELFLELMKNKSNDAKIKCAAIEGLFLLMPFNVSLTVERKGKPFRELITLHF